MMTKSMNLNEALVDVGRQGLVRADKALVVEVAKTLWYSSEVPDLDKVPARFRKDVGYLVDRLARFNVLPKTRKLQLLQAVEQFKSKSQESTASECKDALAVSWGASGDLTRFMPDLLPLQTRHYAATQY